MAAKRIFISMGTPYTPALSTFRDELESMLRESLGVDPRIMNKNEFPTGNPLPKIVDLMKTCDGVIVVANERKFLERGLEKRGSPEPVPLKERRYTTPWNHVESALGFSLGLPLFVVSQKGVQQECLIESKVDWPVLEVSFDKSLRDDPHVLNALRAWVEERVQTHRPDKRIEQLRILELRPAQFTLHDWVALGMLASVVFALGGRFGGDLVELLKRVGEWLEQIVT